MRIIQNGSTVSTAYKFVKLGPYTGRVGNVPCYASVYSIKAKSLRPRYMAGQAFTVQILDDSDNVIAMFGIATPEQVAAHPRGVVTSE